jgi:DNA-binding response OmpR family regulator
MALLRDLLQGEGFRVVSCSSLLELHQAAVGEANLVLTDTWGPSHLTLTACERQQIMDLARLVPTILLTARTWAAHASAYDLGLAAVVSKPFDLESLVNTIRQSATRAEVPPMPSASSL